MADYLEHYLTLNFSPNVRTETRGGREYLVARATLIVPGVLNGSRGPLLYLEEDVARDPSAWNGMPIVVYHPTRNGGHVSGRDPDVDVIGRLYRTQYTGGKLVAEAWFDVKDTQRIDNRVYDSLKNNRPIGLSTGLFTSNTPAPVGSVWKDGRPYSFIAKNYRPDHLAILPDQPGACSLKDGCGILVNSKGEDLWISPGESVFVTNELVGEVDDPDFWTEFSGLVDVLNKSKLPHQKLEMSPEKACKILKDGEVHGHPLTTRQRGMFGALCGKRAKVHNADGSTGELDLSSTPKMLRRGVNNAFCATGKGGGIDPTCGGDGGGGGGSDDFGKEGAADYGGDKHNAKSIAKRWQNKEEVSDTEVDEVMERVSTSKKAPKPLKKIAQEWLDGEYVSDEQVQEIMKFLSNNTQEGSEMPLTKEQRTEIITNLTTNCGCGHVADVPWKGMSTDVLNAKTEEELVFMDRCRKAMAQTNNGGSLPVNPPVLPVNNGQPTKLTPQQWLEQMPAEFRPVWNSAVEVHNTEKASLIQQLTANVEDAHKASAVSLFQNKDVAELRVLLSMMPKPQPVANHGHIPNWFGNQGAAPAGTGSGVPMLPTGASPFTGTGAGTPTNNQGAPAGDGMVPLPPVNHQKAFEEQYTLNATRRAAQVPARTG